MQALSRGSCTNRLNGINGYSRAGLFVYGQVEESHHDR
jgi:hypothetical protein